MKPVADYKTKDHQKGCLLLGFVQINSELQIFFKANKTTKLIFSLGIRVDMSMWIFHIKKSAVIVYQKGIN
jgi:hypothetical protein